MDSESVKGTSIFKVLFLLAVFTVLSGLVIQMDLPTVQDVTAVIKNRFIDRQVALQKNEQEDLLKEGWLYFNIGHYDKAQTAMEKVVEQDANESATYCLGLIDMKYRRYDSAISRFKIVADKSPNHQATRMSLGQAYYQLGYFGQASNEFTKAVKLEPTDEEARLWLGKSYVRLNKTEEALKILETVNHGAVSREAAALMKTIRQQS